MTINEIELYDVEAVDEVLSHLSEGDANIIQKAIASLCGMVTIRDKYIKELKEKIQQANSILVTKTITEYETKHIPGCIQDIAPNKKWSNIPSA
jgi:glutamate-1-semialdehyde aminotransferase